MRSRALLTAILGLLALQCGCLMSPGVVSTGPPVSALPESGKPLGPGPRIGPSHGELVADFDAHAAMAHIRHLAVDIGPRPLGSEAERVAGEYIADHMRGLGWETETQDNIALPGTSLKTQNIVCTHPHRGSGWVVIAGAHYDSAVQAQASPGANDNGSGVAVLLEVARILRHTRLPYQLRLIFFGGEERTRQQPEIHHVGSDHYVHRLNEAKRSQILTMISVDMVGAGPELCASRVGYGADRARQWLLASADRLGLEMTTDTGKAWSDHEAFELAGIPSVWITRMGGDPRWHTADDKTRYIGETALTQSGRLSIRFLLTVSEWLQAQRDPAL